MASSNVTMQNSRAESRNEPQRLFNVTAQPLKGTTIQSVLQSKEGELELAMSEQQRDLQSVRDDIDYKSQLMEMHTLQSILQTAFKM